MNDDAASKALDLIYGRWRSQILYSGAELGVFDRLSRSVSKQSDAVAAELRVDQALLYRLMRALASIGVLAEDGSRGFSNTEVGELFRSDRPDSLRYRVLVAEGPEHYAIWKHLPAMIRDGKQDGFLREFGKPVFEYAQAHSSYRQAFDLGMTGYSAVQSNLALEALQDYDFANVRTICDIGGGQGHLVCALLQAHPHLSGLVFDLAEVFNDCSQLWATKLGLESRCIYIGGNMFGQLPAADLYILKMILHDWNDQECIGILSRIRKDSSETSRVLVIEHIVPSPNESHLAKLFDIHMMCWGPGRERTETEYAQLFQAAGWKHTGSWYPMNRIMGVVEGRPSSVPL